MINIKLNSTARTVEEAFTQFLRNEVRLDTDRSRIAKTSRSWLIDEIKKFPDNGTFPRLHPDTYIEYGSFSRKTKIRPLDDVDLMIILHAQGARYDSSISNELIVYDNMNAFSSLCTDGTNYLNSIKVVNRLKDALGKVPQYRKAEIKRNQEAATLELQTYEWVYDIVPSFITNPELNGRSYYLIPDGRGNWKRTDPRIDKHNVENTNSTQSISVLDVIRLAKFWNSRPTMPSMQSYMLEIMVLNFYKSYRTNLLTTELKDLFQYIASNIYNCVNDPKGIQGDLNELTWDERNKISIRANADFQKASQAIQLNSFGEHRKAIEKWGEIFGSQFPTYNY